MDLINVTLPDGSKKEVSRNSTSFDIAKNIGEGLAKVAIAAKVNGATKDLLEPLKESSNLEIIKIDSKEGLDIIRHTAAHVMAQALIELWPGTKLAIGPTIENGFYYDIDFKEKMHQEAQFKLEKYYSKMNNIEIIIG